MADTTKIEWTDATWQVITGCSVKSPGCTNCYAMRVAGSRLKNHPSRAGLTRDTKAGPVWTGEVRFNEQWLDQPLRWKRPRRIFVCAHGDLFHEDVPDAWIDRVFAVMALCPQHVFQVLTKRADRMRAWFDRYDSAHDHNCADMVADAAAVLLGRPDATGADRYDGAGPEWPLPNVWLGTSVEDQARADERIPDLLATPAAVRWLSMEPLLGPVDLGLSRGWCKARKQLTPGSIEGHSMDHSSPCFGGEVWRATMLDWIVLGGESGPGARPMHPDWARSVRDQCAVDVVPFFFKQWGAWAACPGPNEGHWPADADGFCRLTEDGRRTATGWPMQRVGKKAAGRLLDGVEHNAMPA